VPYYITRNSAVSGCPAWAVLKDDGEAVACHSTKADAIAQMVAISISEKVAIGGDWENRNAR
jgi:phosphatidylglycerophosphate synthase